MKAIYENGILQGWMSPSFNAKGEPCTVFIPRREEEVEADERELAAFRASRTPGIQEEYLPSDEPATEEYSYYYGPCTWVIRCERGRYVYSWTHPCNEDAPTLAEAEALLLAWAKEELASCHD